MVFVQHSETSFCLDGTNQRGVLVNNQGYPRRTFSKAQFLKGYIEFKRMVLNDKFKYLGYDKRVFFFNCCQAEWERGRKRKSERAIKCMQIVEPEKEPLLLIFGMVGWFHPLVDWLLPNWKSWTRVKFIWGCTVGWYVDKASLLQPWFLPLTNYFRIHFWNICTLEQNILNRYLFDKYTIGKAYKCYFYPYT